MYVWLVVRGGDEVGVFLVTQVKYFLFLSQSCMYMYSCVHVQVQCVYMYIMYIMYMSASA